MITIIVRTNDVFYLYLKIISYRTIMENDAVSCESVMIIINNNDGTYSTLTCIHNHRHPPSPLLPEKWCFEKFNVLFFKTTSTNTVSSEIFL
mmetsp:Transcript_17363/g.19442  ORF Transcript_17363/g.19442 Transcript_17363/m.19442 type:complete len:92 (-) Transcript_17363:530-805(-)